MAKVIFDRLSLLCLRVTRLRFNRRVRKVVREAKAAIASTSCIGGSSHGAGARASNRGAAAEEPMVRDYYFVHCLVLGVC